MTLALYGVSYYLELEERSFRETARPSIGTVVGYTEGRFRDHNGRTRTSDFDVYEFRTEDGRLVRFSSAVTGVHPRRAVGASAPLIYQPAEPTRARLDDDSVAVGRKIFGYVVPIGLVLAAIFVVVWWKSERAPRADQRNVSLNSG